MIQANELRVGNYLFNYKNEYINIDQIGGVLVKTDSDWIYNLKELKPIPLTEEILLKCGFDKQGFYFLNINSALMQMEISLSRKCFISSLLAIEIKYIHQLQNLYFALTNEELKLEI